MGDTKEWLVDFVLVSEVEKKYLSEIGDLELEWIGDVY